MDTIKRSVCEQKGHDWETYTVSTGRGYWSEDIEQAGYCLRCKEDTHGQYEKQEKEEEMGMYQVNVRVGECPYTGSFESTINGVKKPFQETLGLANEMLEKGEGNPITIDGVELRVEKAFFIGNRIIAEALGDAEEKHPERTEGRKSV